MSFRNSARWLAAVALMLSSTVHASEPMIVVDGHQDVLLRLVGPEKDRSLDEPGWSGQANLANWKEGGINTIFFAVWIDPRKYQKEKAVERADQLIDCLEEQARLYPAELSLCDTTAEVRRAVKEQKIASLLGIEGGVAINNDISHIERFRKRGVRYMTLTWRGNLKWAGSSQDQGNPAWDRLRSRGQSSETTGSVEDEISSGGLTEFGREVVREMNRVGMVVDLSHVSDQTFYDAVAESKRPVMFSHSNARALAPHPRNISDDMLRALAKNGGVIGVNFWTDLLEPTGAKPEGQEKTSVTLEHMLDMIDHMVKVAGIDSVGIGTDFEGMSSLPLGLESAAKMPNLFNGMRRRGYSEADIRKFAGENFLRVLEANDTAWAPETATTPASGN